MYLNDYDIRLNSPKTAGFPKQVGLFEVPGLKRN